jgi:hypothetical protein
MARELHDLEITAVALVDNPANPMAKVKLFKSGPPRNDLRDRVAKRASELMAQHPTLQRGSATARAAYELESVEKADTEPTLGEWAETRLSALTHTRVAKGATTWLEATAEVQKTHPALCNLRCSGVSTLPFSEAVAAIRKAYAEADYGDRQTLDAWLKAIG